MNVKALLVLGSKWLLMFQNKIAFYIWEAVYSTWAFHAGVGKTGIYIEWTQGTVCEKPYLKWSFKQKDNSVSNN